MASMYRRLMEPTSITASQSQLTFDAMDAGAYLRLEVEVRVLKAGSGSGNVFLQHAAVNEEGSYLAVASAAWPVNATGTFYLSITGFLRFVRWAGDANVAGSPVIQIDVIAKDG